MFQSQYLRQMRQAIVIGSHAFTYFCAYYLLLNYWQLKAPQLSKIMNRWNACYPVHSEELQEVMLRWNNYGGNSLRSGEKYINHVGMCDKQIASETFDSWATENKIHMCQGVIHD